MIAKLNARGGRMRAILMLSLMVPPVSASLASVSTPVAQNVRSPYIRLPLPRGVSLELPRNWTPISGHSKQTMEAAVAAITADKAELRDSELAFAANLYDDNGRTAGIFNIRYYPQLKLSQADVAHLTKEDVSTLDSEMRKGMESTLPRIGMSVILWEGTKLVRINGKGVLLTTYRRTGMANSGPFRVQLVRFIDGSRSFTVTLSYAERMQVLLKPITQYVISSIRVN